MTVELRTSVQIVQPAKGQVTLVLPYEDAEILTRLVGIANLGSLRSHSLALSDVMDTLLEEYGREQDGRYGVRVSDSQAFIYDRENPPF